MPKPIFTKDSCSLYLFRDHKDALKCFGTLARCRCVYHTTNGFCIKLDMGWVEEQSNKDSLYSHITEYMSNRTVRIEYRYVDDGSKFKMGEYVLSLQYTYGKHVCKTLANAIMALVSWEVSSIKIDELLTSMFACVRKDGKISDDDLKKYIWGAIHIYWFLQYRRIDYDWAKSEKLADLKLAREYGDPKRGDLPPYWPLEDHSANPQSDGSIAVKLNYIS